MEQLRSDCWERVFREGFPQEVTFELDPKDESGSAEQKRPGGVIRPGWVGAKELHEGPNHVLGGP